MVFRVVEGIGFFEQIGPYFDGIAGVALGFFDVDKCRQIHIFIVIVNGGDKVV